METVGKFRPCWTQGLTPFAALVEAAYRLGVVRIDAGRGGKALHILPVCFLGIAANLRKLRLSLTPQKVEEKFRIQGLTPAETGARRYLRLLRTLVLHEIPYLAPQGRGRHASPAELAAAAQATWTVLQRKWRSIPGGLDLIADEAHPLGFWRRVVMETHGINLPLRPS